MRGDISIKRTVVSIKIRFKKKVERDPRERILVGVFRPSVLYCCCFFFLKKGVSSGLLYYAVLLSMIDLSRGGCC